MSARTRIHTGDRRKRENVANNSEVHVTCVLFLFLLLFIMSFPFFSFYIYFECVRGVCVCCGSTIRSTSHPNYIWIVYMKYHKSKMKIHQIENYTSVCSFSLAVCRAHTHTHIGEKDLWMWWMAYAKQHALSRNYNWTASINAIKMNVQWFVWWIFSLFLSLCTESTDLNMADSPKRREKKLQQIYCTFYFLHSLSRHCQCVNNTSTHSIKIFHFYLLNLVLCWCSRCATVWFSQKWSRYRAEYGLFCFVLCRCCCFPLLLMGISTFMLLLLRQMTYIRIYTNRIITCTMLLFALSR